MCVYIRTGYRFAEIEVLAYGGTEEARRHDRRLVRWVVALVHLVLIVVVLLLRVQRFRPLRHSAAAPAAVLHATCDKRVGWLVCVGWKKSLRFLLGLTRFKKQYKL